MASVLGIDIGGNNFRLGIFGRQGKPLLRSEGRTDSEGGREWMLKEIYQRSQPLIAKADRQVEACGISFGGPVDYDRQRVSSVHVSGWQDFDLARWIKEKLHLDCLVDNDANAGALGEFRYGAGRGTHSIVYVTLSTGIGGGVVCEGKLLHGRDSLAGELGHIPLSDAGAPCSCGGRGCLESLCSGTAIGRRGRELAKNNPDVFAQTIKLASGNPGAITAETIFRAAAEGEKGATFVVRETARWLARGLLTAIRILNPDRVILGGGVALAGRHLLDPLQEYLEVLKTPQLRYSTEIVLAELGNDSPLYGAAALGWQMSEEPQGARQSA